MKRSWIPLVALAAALVAAVHAVAQTPLPFRVPPVSVAAPRPVALRVQWGGGQPRAWAGTIAVVAETGAAVREPEWRTLCTEPDAAAMVHADGGTLVVHQPRPVAADGVEIVVPDTHGWRIVAALGPAGSSAAATIDAAVADLLAREATEALDADGNRLAIRVAPGESLRATVETADGRGNPAACRPGERLRVTVDPLLPVRDGTAAVELRLRLKSRGDGAEIVSQAAALVPLPTPGDVDAGAAGGRRPLRFEPVRFEFPLPSREGTWNAEFEAVEGSGLGWSRSVASRSLTLVTIAGTRPQRVDAADWRLVYELDPGSPRLHERLRRLPGVGLPAVPLPQVPLPSLSRPTLPRLPLPAVPVPQVSLPQVPALSAMVPRLSGLLASGHSRVEPHALGPMLQLPPAESEDTPAWEGVVIAGAEPGMPHVVEVDYPSDQTATVGLVVLELDAAGGRVESRHSGGFAVRRDGEPARLGTHRFVFWPATRHPVVLLANQSRSDAALVGHVRILAGPAHLPAAAVAPGRRVHAFLGDASLGGFGAAGDWPSRVAAISRSAEAIVAQGAAGAMLVVHAEGAATWPSRCTRGAPRWTGDAAATAAATPDLLAAACLAYEREGLRLVPAVACDGPLAALEAQLARGGPAAAGIACIGRDGRPRTVGRLGCTHYNVLDPRVQHAVEELVRELAGRLRGAVAVDGVALLLPHDGWLHLPGVDWGLDDATFARFRAAAGVEDPADGDDRFAARAALVEGPLRDRWLEWRAGEIAGFHGRLADVLAEHNGRWSLFVAPTTLCSAGPLAERLRPTLGPVPAADAVLREAGLDPLRGTAHRRVVFVSPHVHGGAGLAARGGLAAGNAAAARATAAAARRGVLVLEEPVDLDVRSMVPHGPFGSALAGDPFPVCASATGIDAGRALAESFASADAEVVFDARLGLALPVERSPGRAAVEALVPAPLAPVPNLPVPLVVRASRGDDATWVHLVNAAGAAASATLTLSGRPAAVMDAASGAAIESRDGEVRVDLPAWGMRTLRVDGEVAVVGGRLDYDPRVAARIESRVERLGRRRQALEQPAPLDVLDNPGFELGSPPAEGRPPSAGVTGWEVVESRRGTVTLAPGRDGGRAAAFASTNGLSTLRSNPFPPPASGRASVAAWLRIRDGDRQPPLRMSLEGIRDDREYYRFAAVGGLAGGRPLTGEWQQFVLLVDDLPEAGLESLRVRFDLLGPGTVEIDDVRVFDLAFTEPERVQLARQVGQIEAAVAAGDLGGCLVGLDGYWPRFLEAHVSVPSTPAPPATPAPAPPTPPERTGVLDRMWRMWQ